MPCIKSNIFAYSQIYMILEKVQWLAYIEIRKYGLNNKVKLKIVKFALIIHFRVEISSIKVSNTTIKLI